MRILAVGVSLAAALLIVLGAGWIFKDAVLLRISACTTPKVADSRPVQWQKAPQTPMASPSERPPNIILIVADDLGLNDISLKGGGRGGGSVQTPHIDAIAREGVVMETAYAAHATGAPSRAGLLTGRYPTRFGFEFAPASPLMSRLAAQQKRDDEVAWVYHREKARGAPSFKDMGMPAAEVTLAELLGGRGYHTVHLGKWALGAAKGMRPEEQGFEESLGFMGAAQKYALPDTEGVVSARLEFDPTDKFLWATLPFSVQYNGSEPFRPKGYMTDYLTEQALEVIGANRNRSFFLYMAYNAPHMPLQATQADYDALSYIADHKERVYAAMIVALDRGVGRIMQALKDEGLDNDTLVIFTSDNGATGQIGIEGLNAPYRGWKQTLFEGGVRVPMFLRWPARFEAGTRVMQTVSHLDLFATVAAAAKAPLPGREIIDGVDLTPYILGERTNSVHEALFWRSGGYRSVRSGKWKLQLQQLPRRIWLYDLEADPAEKTNLAQQRPEVVDYLTTRIQLHDRQQAEPLWPSLLQVPVALDKTARQEVLAKDAYVVWPN